MSDASAARRLAALIGPEVARAGVDLEDVEVVAAGRRRLLRVLVDKDGGVSLDDIAALSRRISAVLDETAETDAVLGSAAYVLEVSSRGVDRPLTQPRHWRRAVGRLVRVVLVDDSEFTGRVVESDVEGARVAIRDDGEAAPRWVPLAQVRSGRVQVEFNRAESSTVGLDSVQAEESP